MMYKMGRKPVSRLVGGSSSADTNPFAFGETRIPSIMKSNYHDHITPLQIQRKPSATSYSTDEYPLFPTTMSQSATGTRELAEFLKSSRPEDYGQSSTTGSLEDLPVNHSHRKGLRFLRSALSRDLKDSSIPRIQSPGPVQLPHVVSKTTTKGKPYLQIQVNYGQLESGKENKEASSSKAISETPTKTQPVSDTDGMTGTNSASSDSIKTIPRSLPETERFVLSAMESFQEFYQQYSRDSDHNRLQLGPTLSLKTTPADIGNKSKRLHGVTLRAPNTPFKPLHSPIDRPKTPDRSSVISVDLTSYYSSTAQTQPPTLHLNPSYHRRSNSQDNSVRSSARSDVTNDDASIDGSSEVPVKHSVHVQPQHAQLSPHHVRKLPKPGPPPNRELPSLPEDQDEKPAVDRLNVPKQDILTRSESPVPISPVEEDELLSRKTRQERVRARKARDMGEMHKLRLAHDKKLQEAIKQLDNDIEQREKLPQSPTSNSSLATASIDSTGRRHSARQTRRGSAEKSNKPHQSPIKITAADFPLPGSASLRETIAAESRRRSDTSNTAAAAATAVVSTRNNSYTPTAKEVELEMRLSALERRNWVLEHALIAILHKATGRGDSESSPIHGRDTLESLLAEMNMEIPIPP